MEKIEYDILIEIILNNDKELINEYLEEYIDYKEELNKQGWDDLDIFLNIINICSNDINFRGELYIYNLLYSNFLIYSKLNIIDIINNKLA